MSGTRRGESGGPTSASDSGGQSARTTARTATRGSTSRTITRGRARTTGARTVSRAFAISSSDCVSPLALWNGKDPILKERLFGLSNGEGNHGEDVKEYYFYLDSTPTHSYMKWLYKYPQAAFPVHRSRDDECAPLTAGVRVRADRHRRVRRRSLLRRLRRIREVISGGMLRPDHRRESWSGDRDDSSVADTVVPQHVGMVARSGEAPPVPRRSEPAARASWRRLTRSLAIDGCTATARRRCCSPRTTRIPSGSSARPTRLLTSRTPSTRSWFTEKPTP